MEAYQELEQRWAKRNGLDPAGMVACSSGTSALHLAFEVLKMNGTKALMSDLNMVACPRATVLAGAVPHFVDCKSDLLIDAEAAHDWVLDDKNNAYGSLSAILATHIYGRQCDMDKLWQVASDVGSVVVEDLAEAHGVIPDRGTAAACYSFYRNKIVAGEEGGAVWFSDPKRAAHAKQLRSLGFTDAHDFRHVPRGHNYRMSNLHASAVLASLANFENNLYQRRIIEEWHEECCPEEWKMRRRDAVWVYDLRIPGMTEEVQDRVVGELKREGIAARHCFKPMREMEEWSDWGRAVPGPNAIRLSREILYLPVQPGITTKESVRKAFDIIQRVIDGAR